MIKTNCELPVGLFDKNIELNDFDFILYHLLSNKKYKEYYSNLPKDRMTILDTSAYEFYIKKKKFKAEDYIQAIKTLKPNFFLLPDTLMRMEKTIEDSVDFHRRYSPEIYTSTGRKSLPMGVLQGNSPEELIKCIKLYRMQCIYDVAVPFHNSFYKEIKADKDIREKFLKFHGGGSASEDMKYAMGRVQFLRQNAESFKYANHIHILGSHDPYEKVFYDKIFPGKELTMDTGYPVKIAITGWELGKTKNKPDIILDEFLEEPIDPTVEELILNNIRIFKSLK